jgi:hypothetical protein
MIRSSPTSPAENVLKRQCLESCVKIKAQDIIRFHCLVEDHNTTNSNKILFTHQVFENEEIDVTIESSNVVIDLYFHTSALKTLCCIENIPKTCIDYTTIQHALQSHMIAAHTLFDHASISLETFIQDCKQTSVAAIGSLLHSIPFQNDKTLQLRLSTYKTPGAAEALQILEKLSLWYIETADSIDFTDERFELLLAYTNNNVLSDHNENNVSVAGYMTLFTFINPFAGNKIRICQALVMPHLHGYGIGREMILSVYRLAQNRPDITEVTVEDPAEGFSRLRDVVDCEWVFIHKSYEGMVDAKEEDKVLIAKRLKITLSQYIFAIETLEYMQLKSVITTNDVDDETDDDVLRVFRLKVKRRLMKDHSEIKSASKDKMRIYLEELYEERRERYDNVIKNATLKRIVDFSK